MKTMIGTMLLVQEGRFQLRDEEGASHLFVLGHTSLAETEQLAPLAARQARLRVSYTEAPNIVGLVAKRIFVLDGPLPA